MLALLIALTWLTLTAGGYAALTALGRRERRQDLGAGHRLLDPETNAPAYTPWPALSGAGAR
jgi:hypothetical protein